MDRKEKTDNLVGCLIPLAGVASAVKDDFFLSRLEKKVFGFVYSFIELLESEGKSDVAQRQFSFEKCISEIDATLDLLGELAYLNLIEKDNPLFVSSEHNLLELKLGVIRSRKSVRSEKEIKKEDTVEPEKNIIAKKPEALKKKENITLTGSKKKILDYIKQYPEIRTKDIIYEFNSLSGRTIKRNLTDLLKTGFVRKRVNNKAVFYSIAE